MSKQFLAMTSFEHLRGKRNRTIFVGDHEDAERCKKLERRRIDRYFPSQWRDRFPGGYIQFPVGRGWDGCKLYDISRGTIGGKPAYIFEDSETLNSISRRLTAIEKCREHIDCHRGGDLKAYAEIVVEESGLGFKLQQNENALRQQIYGWLPLLKLADLEALAETAKQSVLQNLLRAA